MRILLFYIIQSINKFIISIERCIPILTQLLGSKNQSDIIASISLLTLLQKMKIERAVEGTKKILILFFNKENEVKERALASYKELYLTDEMSLDKRAFALIELLKDADSNEEACVEEFLSLAVKNKAIPGDIYKALMRVFKM